MSDTTHSSLEEITREGRKGDLRIAYAQSIRGSIPTDSIRVGEEWLRDMEPAQLRDVVAYLLERDGAGVYNLSRAAGPWQEGEPEDIEGRCLVEYEASGKICYDVLQQWSADAVAKQYRILRYAEIHSDHV